MPQKKASPLLWLLLIPGQLVAGGLFIWLGLRIDQAIFSKADTVGHGIPIFSVIFLLAAAVMTLAVFIVSLVLTVRGLRRRKREQAQVGGDQI